MKKLVAISVSVVLLGVLGTFNGIASAATHVTTHHATYHPRSVPPQAPLGCHWKVLFQTEHGTAYSSLICWHIIPPSNGGGTPPPPTTPPQGGTGGNSGGDNPPPFVKSQRNGVLYCAPTALHRVGERDGRAMNLGVGEISDSGVYNYSEGPVQMTNAFYVYEAGPFYGAGCDLPPGYVVTSTRVDNLGNPDPNGPYYAAVPIKP